MSQDNNPVGGNQPPEGAGPGGADGGAPANPDEKLLEGHDNLVSEFFEDHPNSLVNGVAVGYLPGDESPEIVVFVDPTAAKCEREAIDQTLQEVAPGQPHTLLRASRFVALSSLGERSISPFAPFRYNLPPVIAGTLGAVVKAGGLSYALTSNHVLAHNGRARQNTPVALPGPLDDANGGSLIARRSDFVELKAPGWPILGTPTNLVDCALAEGIGALSSSSPRPIGVFPYPFSVQAAGVPGANPPRIPRPIPIDKSGRTTGFTSSKISLFRLCGHIDMSFGLYHFRELMGTYDGVPPGTAPTSPAPVFAAPGDSGALAVSGNDGVGLITARGYVFNKSGQFAAYVILICSLDLVQRALIPFVGQTEFLPYP
jgi:hypothetical protein